MVQCDQNLATFQVPSLFAHFPQSKDNYWWDVYIMLKNGHGLKIKWSITRDLNKLKGTGI